MVCMDKMTIVVALAGATVIVGGVSFIATDLIAGVNEAVDSANFHQLATALEVYYAMRQEYPQVSGGDALVDALFDGKYIRTKPLYPSVFAYEAENGGQDYSLKVVRGGINDGGADGGSAIVAR